MHKKNYFLLCVSFVLVIALKPAMAGNNSGAAFSTWPDTGQTTCYDADGNVLDPCPAAGQPFHGQDAQYQGPSRSYTKLDGSGNDLAVDAVDWVMVRDNITGLIWEVKQSKDGAADYTNPHDADNTYTWCDTNPNTNGGDVGTCGEHDTEDFLNALNVDNFGGHSDWRLPTFKELVSLFDYSMPYSCINPDMFPNSVLSSYWSATSSIHAYSYAFTASFGSCWTDLGNSDKRRDAFFVRAVRDKF